MKREPFKDIELMGRKWRIGRFDALTGSYISALLLMQVIPMGIEGQLGIKMPLSNERSIMEKKTFIELQLDCLRVCSEIKEVGGSVAPIPVLMSDGRWGIEDIETDISLVIGLTIHTLIFNITDFFQGNTLKSLSQSFEGLDLSLFNVKK